MPVLVPRRRRLLSPAIAVALFAIALAGSAAPARAADTPSGKPLYDDGPDGRYLMGGSWLFRRDNAGLGLKDAWQRQASTTGWTRTTVPMAWNNGDNSNESMAGGVGWYRKDFKVPSRSSAYRWIVRFESANYRLSAWLNGRSIGSHTGAYLPFELDLDGVKRGGVNRLVVRIDSRRHEQDFPPSSTTDDGVPRGGWWNYSGLTREVYLRRVRDVDLPAVAVTPTLACASCSARVALAATVRNPTGSGQRVSVRARFGNRSVALGSVGVGPGRSAQVTKTISIAKPRLWSPDKPSRYSASFEVVRGGAVLARQRLRTGIRQIKVSGGRLLLNGRPLNWRGFGIHEDDKTLGNALDNAARQRIVDEAKDAGATFLRGHYPLHPQLLELADKEGLLVWSEIPVYGTKTQVLAERSVRDAAAEELEENITANRNHPSIIVWSLGNELSTKPGPVQGYYIQAAANQARKLDPSRAIGLAVAAWPSAGCQTEYAPLDVIGFNEYFGWYSGPNGQTADREQLSAYLDALRACYPKQALAVTEFGAEANREGPPEEKGTYAFQADFVKYHLDVFATKPWLSGATYWTLEEFRVRPGWDGGNPRPAPPVHQKAVIDWDGKKKPAYYELQKSYRATQQLLPRRTR
jgi:beta-glucuronidase